MNTNVDQRARRRHVNIWDEAFMDELAAELANVIQQTLQPASASLWLSSDRGEGS